MRRALHPDVPRAIGRVRAGLGPQTLSIASRGSQRLRAYPASHLRDTSLGGEEAVVPMHT